MSLARMGRLHFKKEIKSPFRHNGIFISASTGPNSSTDGTLSKNGQDTTNDRPNKFTRTSQVL